MRGRRDLGGQWPKCPNAPHSGTYMDAQRVVWALRGMLSRSRLHPAWSFFSKRKSTGAHPGSQRLSVAKQVSFDPNVGTTRKRLECRPIGQNQEDGVKLTLPRFRKDPHPLLGDPTPGVPKKNGNAIVPRHDHQQNSGTLTDEPTLCARINRTIVLIKRDLINLDYF